MYRDAFECHLVVRPLSAPSISPPTRDIVWRGSGDHVKQKIANRLPEVSSATQQQQQQQWWQQQVVVTPIMLTNLPTYDAL